MRLLKWFAIFVVVAVATLAFLRVAFGLHLEFTGAGRPRLAFAIANEEQAEIVARHRAAQRTGSGTEASPEPPQATEEAPAPSTAAEAASAPGETTPEAYWTDFRGPTRDGHYRERAVLAEWPVDGPPELWRQPVGGGYASFVAAEGRAFTIEQRGPEEVVAAYEVSTGREVWTHAWPALFEETMGGDGPRATPTWSAGLIYALGALGEFRCLDAATGQLIWRTNILEDSAARNLDWGMAAAPLVVGETIVVAPGGPDGGVVAYDRRSGVRVWAAEQDKAGYSSPMLASLAGRDQLLVFAGTRLMALAPDTGTLLWSYPWETNADINVVQPLIVGGDRVFISSSYGVGGALLEVSASGDRYRVTEVWRNNRMKNRFASAVLHEGFIYGLDEGILACMNAETGELMWKGGRYGYGQILLASGRVIVLAENGDLALVVATPAQHEELRRVPALEGKTWNPPAISDGILLVRNAWEMAAFDLRVP